jgi:hypothetical protein
MGELIGEMAQSLIKRGREREAVTLESSDALKIGLYLEWAMNMLDTFDEDEKKLAAQLAPIEVPCCHTTGTHDPTHFNKRKYVCIDQLGRALLRVSIRRKIPLVLVSSPDCSWCNGTYASSCNPATEEPIDAASMATAWMCE